MYCSGAGHNGFVTAELGSGSKRLIEPIIPTAVALIVAQSLNIILATDRLICKEF